MPRIDIRHSYACSPAEARAVIEEIAARMREKFGIESQWQDDTLRFSRAGVKGAIALGADAVQVTAELGLMLSPLKGMVEQEIRRKLDQHFGQTR